MNKKLFLIPLIVLGLITFFTSCETTPAEQCFESPELCEQKTTTICCDENDNCNYTYNGKTYPDTAEGIEALISAMCPDATAALFNDYKIKLSAETLELMKEARVAALCN